MQIKSKKRLFAKLVLLVLLVMLCVTWNLLEVKASGFTIRNSPPATSNKYYYDSAYNANAGDSEYKMPNCTTYVLGRVYEITGKRFNIWGDAGEYYANNSSYACSTNAYEPALGAVVCYSGHVQVVEEIGEDSGGRYICVSESNHSGRETPSKSFNYMKIYLADLANSKNTGQVPRTLLEDNDGYSYEQEVNKNFSYAKFQGYIYPEGVDKDTEAPVISNAYVTDVSATGYTVVCTVTDNVKTARVCFPTWTDANGQDDIDWNWYENAPATSNVGNTYYYRVNTSDHNNESGIYHTHIFAYDTSDNASSVVVTAIIDTEAPVISNAYVTDVSAAGYTVVCTVTDNVKTAKVCFPTWTDANGQDDIDWDWYENAPATSNVGNTYYYRVNTSDHNNEKGIYHTHIFAYDTSDNASSVVVTAIIGQEEILISNAYATDVSATGYTVVCTVNVATSKVCFPTWTEENWQDDLDVNWYENAKATSNEGNTYYYRVNTSDHNNEYGTYITHIYAYDTRGNYNTDPVRVTAEVPAPTPTTLPFTDVPQGSWYYDYVANVYEKGYMVGSGTTFGPKEPLTRAQVVTTLYSVNGKPSTTFANNFSDVVDGKWYSNPISWAYRNGIVSGYGNGKFGTSNLVTREQFALMLYQYASTYSYNTNYSDSVLNGYTDAGKVSSWASTAMKWAVTNEIISGKTATTLDPKGNATRAQCATMITKLEQLKNK